MLLGLGLLKVVVIVLAGRLFDHPKVGRRPLLLASNAGIALALVILAINFSMGEPSVGWAVLALALFVCFFSLGMGPGCWLIASEVFSTQVSSGRWCAVPKETQYPYYTLTLLRTLRSTHSLLATFTSDPRPGHVPRHFHQSRLCGDHRLHVPHPALSSR